MSEIKLTKTRIQAGTYEGVLQCAPSVTEPPKISVFCGDTEIERPVIEQFGQPGTWGLRFAIPAGHIGDGFQCFTFMDVDNDQPLDSFVIAAGDPVHDNLRAEVELLRAELNILKRAFRRHCIGTS